MTTVYWGNFLRPNESSNALSLLLMKPEPVFTHIINERDALDESHFTKCPAFQDYYKNTFVVKSPIDITLNYDKQTKHVFISPQNQEFYDRYVYHRGDQIGDLDPLLLTLNFQYVFVADKECLIEQLPAHFHNTKGFRVITGTYDISKWFRPVEFAFELLEDEVKIKRGDALFYVRFLPKDKKKVSLVAREYSKEEQAIFQKCTLIKNAQHKMGLDALYELAKKVSKDFWFNKSKCPFKWGNK